MTPVTEPPRLPHRVVVVGGGFGGLYAARSLGIDPEVRLTLVDRRNFHLFQPLLYQVATGALSPGEIAQPLRSLLRRQRNTTVILGEAVGLDAERREVLLADGGPIAYDTLIVATGAHHSYFDHPEWATLAPGLKTIEDATEIRRRILIAFEAAEREADPDRRREWMTFVMVGGGPTGVELAGALGEIAHDTLKRDFRAIRSGEARIVLVEAVDRILPPYPPDRSRSAQRQLERLGVEVRTRTRVVDITERSVQVIASDGATSGIPSRTVLWAAGVRASTFARTVATATGAETDRAGRVIVSAELTIPGHPEIFIVGDAAVQPWKADRPVPGVAQGAIQGGKYAAAAIRRRILNRPVEPFRYSDRGDVAVIGRLSGVTNIGWLGPFGKQSGFVAWGLWLGIHILYLIGFSNRLVVLTRWAWSFLTHGRSTRLITGTTLLPPIEEPEPPVLAPLEPGDLPGPGSLS
jgi:NADH:ubiquinone reductase (H+-translocating)